MALPTITRLWQCNVSNLVAFDTNNVTTNKQILLAAKEMLVGDAGSWTNLSGTSVPSPTGLWSVYYSCNGTAAGTAGDVTDRWVTKNDIVFASASNAHSWIVLKQPGLKTNFQLLIDCKTVLTASGLDIGFYFSQDAGFSGGSTTARPTATDEVAIARNVQGTCFWGGYTSGSAGSSMAIHAFISTDGKGTHVAFSSNNKLWGLWAFDKSNTAPAPWAGYYGLVCGSTSSGVDAGTRVHQNNVNSGLVFLHTSSLLGFRGLISGEFAATASSINQVSNDFSISDLNFWANDSIFGHLGALNDVWWCNGLTGYTFPSDGTKQYVQIGKMLFPWNRTAPILG